MSRVNASATSPAINSLNTLPRDVTDPTHRVDIDAVRVIAAVMVVTIHVTSIFVSIPERAGQSGGITYWVALLANLASRSAVPMFFAMSGWALMKNAAVRDEVQWLGRRLGRLLLPLLVWNVIYVGVALVVARAAERPIERAADWPVGWLLREMTLILAGPGTAASLWFLYFLVPLTLLIWVIRVAPRAIADRRIRVPFGGAIAALILPYGLVGAFQANISWAAFAWAVGYAVLGYVLLSIDPPRRRVSVPLFLGTTIGLVVAEQLIGYDHWEMANNGPLVFVQTIGLIGLVRSIRIGDRWKGPLATAATLTFGVYLVHLVFVQMFQITLGTSSLPQLLVLGVSWLGTLTLSFAAVALWHRRPTLIRILG